MFLDSEPEVTEYKHDFNWEKCQGEKLSDPRWDFF